MTIYYSEEEILNTEIYCPLHNHKAYQIFNFHDYHRGYEFRCSVNICNFNIFLCYKDAKYSLKRYDLYFKKNYNIFYLCGDCRLFTNLINKGKNIFTLPFIDLDLKNFNRESEKLFNRLLKLVAFK